jgi:hypothetical protein
MSSSFDIENNIISFDTNDISSDRFFVSNFKEGYDPTGVDQLTNCAHNPVSMCVCACATDIMYVG